MSRCFLTLGNSAKEPTSAIDLKRQAEIQKSESEGTGVVDTDASGKVIFSFCLVGVGSSGPGDTNEVGGLLENILPQTGQIRRIEFHGN